MWQLFQIISALGWDHFKILPLLNAPSLVEAIRTLYGPSVPEELSPDIEITVDKPIVEKAPFTTVIAKKHKDKDKALLSVNPQTSL